jgi:hypothetical protein
VLKVSVLLLQLPFCFIGAKSLIIFSNLLVCTFHCLKVTVSGYPYGSNQYFQRALIVEVVPLLVMTAAIEKVLESSVMVMIVFSGSVLVQMVSTWTVLLKVTRWLARTCVV